MLNKTISVCCAKDIHAWTAAAARLPECVAALKYEVVVPDTEVALFQGLTPPVFSVMPESYYLGGRSLSWLKARMPATLQQRAGWYLQQFIKIEACRQAGPDVNCLIWDADTVPLRSLCFEDPRGRLIYYKGNHRPLFHSPYFDLIRTVLGLERGGDHSFIAQCFPLRTPWVEHMCQTLEQRYSAASWIDVIVDHIDHSKGGCGFSEYETLGTFFTHHYAKEIVFTDRQFLRHGSLLLGSPDQLVAPAWSGLAQAVDYVAFEAYETGRYRGLHIGCGNTRIEATFRGNPMLNTDISKFNETDLLLDVTHPLPFPDHQFEHIVANNVLEHVDDMIAVVTELDRCLQPGGVLQIEVPFLGSYNHGTDVTHKRGLTFDAFNFLLADGRNYLFRVAQQRPFNYRLVSFFRENVIDGALIREESPAVPVRGTYADWLEKVARFEVPGTFGYVWQKLA